MEIKLPAYVTLTNKSDATVKFAPYKENFNTALGKGESLLLVAETAGQVFYYLKQATDAIEVDVKSEKPSGTTYDVCATADAPATITVTNKSTTIGMNFVPYRENFQYTVKPGEVFTFDATTAGQVIYYMNQDVDGLLDIQVGTSKVGKH